MGPAALADRNHEGHSGWRIDQIDSQVGGWLSTYQPEVVLLLIGTNDIVQDHQLSTAPARLGALLDRIHQLRPATKLIVSSVPPLANASDNTQAAAYNANVRSHVDARAAAGRSISFVDAAAALTVSDLADGIHPTSAGYAKLADVWHPAIGTALGSPSVALTAPTSGTAFASAEPVPFAAAPTGLRRDRARGVLCRSREEAGRGRRCAVRMGMAEPQRGRSLFNRSCRRCDGGDRDIGSCFDRGRRAGRAEGVLPGHQYLRSRGHDRRPHLGARRAPQTSRRFRASTRTNRCHSSRPQTLPGQR